MLITVLTEPNFRSYLWAQQTLEGVTREAGRRKYRLVTLDADTYEEINYDRLFGTERRMLIVIGTSISWMPKALDFFSSRNIESVFVSFDPAETTLPTGMVRMDYVGAIHHLLNYLTADCGKSRIAMYGYNPNSSADQIKLRYFQRWCRQSGQSAENDVFYNLADLNACYSLFRTRAAQFDAVICANDIVGVSLLSLLRRDGLRVPEDLCVAAFGDSRIAERTAPPLTVATLDHSELGRQAVQLFSYLCKTPTTASVSARIRSKLIVRESTGSIPDAGFASHLRKDADGFEASINFYSDPEAVRLLGAETLLNACDETDLRLLEGLVSGASLESLEHTLYLTVSALQYRKKRLMKIVDCSGTDAFMEFLTFCRQRHVL